MKKMFVGALAVVFALVGCQGYNNADRYDTNRNTENTRYEQTRYNNDNANQNPRFSEMKNREDNLNRRNNAQMDRDGNEYRVSKEAADRITSELPEINQAYVLTTKNNAYVAATLDNDNNRAGDNVGTREDGTDNRNDATQNTRNSKNNRSDHSGTDTNRGDDLTDEVKNKIADIVQSVDKDIDNVYVTTSPDFVNLSNDYVNEMDQGSPIRGFFDQIGDAIERVFPQDKANNNQGNR